MSVSDRTYIKPEQMQKSIKVQTLFSFIKVTNKAKNSTKLPCNVDNSWGKPRIRNFCYFSWYLTFKLMHRNLKKVPAPRWKRDLKACTGLRWLIAKVGAERNFKIHNIGKIVWKKMEILLLPTSSLRSGDTERRRRGCARPPFLQLPPNLSHTQWPSPPFTAPISHPSTLLQNIYFFLFFLRLFNFLLFYKLSKLIFIWNLPGKSKVS